MPHGSVPLITEPDDRLTAWLCACLTRTGYAARTVGQPTTRPALVSSALPVAAGMDLWRVSTPERRGALDVLETQLPVGCPLLVRCEALPVDVVASWAARPTRVVGFSAFGVPRDGMLVEVVPATRASPEAVRRATMFLESLGFQVRALPVGSWPIFPRMMAMVINEAAKAMGEGTATAADIDQAMKLGANDPEGPLALADRVGLAEILEILEGLHSEFGDDRYHPAPLLRRLVRAGDTGQAAGRGFHLYDQPS
ncbi:MAG TPA: 3-hydroxyacyl-CoA dehydrogenase family protein [Chloroflexota bacterium]|nr:3-hydroxyacyl-CoA dehydrogenase family protein [Chloroflexota bacterium]